MLPAPETEATIVDYRARRRPRRRPRWRRRSASPFSVTGAAHSPPVESEPARTLHPPRGLRRVGGRSRRSACAPCCRDFGRRRDSGCRIPRRSLWLTIRDLDGLSAPLSTPIWRVSVRPSDGPAVADAARAAFPCARALRLGRRPRLDRRRRRGRTPARRSSAPRSAPSAATRRWSARRTMSATPSRSSSRCDAGDGPDAEAQSDLRPRRDPQPRPHVCRRLIMQTNFTLAQLADPDTAVSEKILRSCVHCGFCTATCPTYVLLGDELDSPRGRIYLIKDMLEGGKAATEEVVTHVDRCLSCLACMTTCPSGVDYMHLVDHARAHIDETYERAAARSIRPRLLAAILPHPARFRAAVVAAFLGQALGADPSAHSRPRRASPRCSTWRPCASAHVACQPAGRLPGRGRAQGQGGAAPRLRPVGARSRHQRGAIRLLTRNGIEVVLAEGEGCCGALVHHMGRARRLSRCCPPQHRCLDARNRRRGPRRDRRHHVGLRHDDQGLRLHAPQRAAYADKGSAGLGARQGHHRVSGDARPRRPATPRSARRSPITPPVRCSTASR